MAEFQLIPMFPLTLLPLPGELVPLHIFEPRYRQLLTDCETHDITFGIFCNHDFNTQRIGSLMKLESVIKRYPTGESDIIVRCVDVFAMDKLYRTYKEKKYPGGDISLLGINPQQMPGAELYELFVIYQSRRNITKHVASFNIYQIAEELNLDLYDRYKLLTTAADKPDAFLQTHLKFQLHVLLQEEKSKDVFHLN